MEIIQIKSKHSLVTNVVSRRPVEDHSYTVNCRQYLLVFQLWQQNNPQPTDACDIMTLDSSRIWLTEQEGKTIVEAIKSSCSPVLLD